ncbi:MULTISPECIES: nucleoside-diphosphate kinase [unclassified Roseiflexus]|jgi:nucleoside-diphosphate kinase|uniref:Nucleoside diphosphate kinase n=1 Tax=Roseiflexus sp. (strain RS-1) TaxID=357808 RepID=NDK_ROSS1|nr:MULTISPECIES: nucleoside-diphosphate kinase [unclassified Roseiflexus]A5URD5.1 RecName: Full=Nucleoside diphosphate kinase; Short=NDK; Short=NDP kinase; AltName: Full=Nucleoside-2-P kinase [Roseiflexus sp. RS-1]ABQ89188.1 nucleoside diphosphate kinase [Roseiflexus sp. RS-1]MCL6540187.1 nucleoside-diphosphate kinase [Roseiflexus sp.]
MERSLIILKPDAVQRGLIGPILTRIEQRGLRIVGMKLMQIDESLARRHYAIHEGKAFFDSLITYITSGPVVVLVVTGKNIIEIVRSMVGATNPVKAAPGTIRGDFALDIGRNLIHASDSPENGEMEVSLFFRPEELVEMHRSTDQWIYE